MGLGGCKGFCPGILCMMGCFTDGGTALNPKTCLIDYVVFEVVEISYIPNRKGG